MASIKIDNLEIKLYYNTKAMMEIAEDCGGKIEDMSQWVAGEDVTTAQKLERTSMLICRLANGEIYKHNCEVEFGLKEGEKKRFYTPEFFLTMINPNKLQDYSSEIFKAMSDGSTVSVPENVKLSSGDADLEEIEEEKNQ